MTATEFRRRLYTVRAELAETGGTATVAHKGRRFRIVAENAPRFTDRLVRHDTLKVDADDLVAAESGGWDWTKGKNL